jgi:protein-S-isoprenylcysteine O-methyltransferase Ste14
MSDTRLKLTPGVVVQLALVVVLIPLLPLLISGRWGWVEAWLYFALCAGGFVVSRAIAGRRNPGLLQERGRSLQHADTQAWDRVLAPLVGIGGGVIPLVIGLDVRYGWSGPFSLGARLAGLALMLAGYALASWALAQNRFFSGVVRIQTERGHQVVSTGPYALVRHPGYAGAWLAYVGMPLLLASWWGLVPVALLTVALVVRTRLEDRTLQAELIGYKEYTQRVRWRLLPGLW